MNLATRILFLAMLLFAFSCNKNRDIYNSQYPFPHHTNYVGTHIKPNKYRQSELDKHTRKFYDAWAKKYLKNDCDKNRYYVYSGDGAKTVSEAHGYGMMIMCFMAGYERKSKEIFDGLFWYYKDNPSKVNSSLMDWQQLSCNEPANDDDDAASDGDIDIAFSLLLAHSQWGSDGVINYLAEAKNLIQAIMKDEINAHNWTVKLGDWCDSTDPNYFYGTRTSDFIMSHFKIFSHVTNNSDWNKVIDTCYAITQKVQHKTTGLVPDFVVHTNTNAVVAGKNYLESEFDGDYYYNACRFPWRIGIDYLTSGDVRAQNALEKINSWLAIYTQGNVNKISNGFLLNGKPLYDWSDPTFLGPFTVGAMADITNQNWLNVLYEELLDNKVKDGDYYSNTIALLSMIVISGNYWNPAL